MQLTLFPYIFRSILGVGGIIKHTWIAKCFFLWCFYLACLDSLFPPIGCVVPGAGAVEVAIAEALINYKLSIKGRARLGVQAFADALLIIPKVQLS